MYITADFHALIQIDIAIRGFLVNSIQYIAG